MDRAKQRLLRIGELARESKLSPDTLRHYERLGILSPAGRTAGGFRTYAADALRRVRTIQAALALGFKLREIALLLRARAAGRPPCRSARRIAAERLCDIEAELERLQTLRDVLRSVVERWDERLLQTAEGEPALLLESLADVPAVGTGGKHEKNARFQGARRARAARQRRGHGL
jgi:DNA-binding transcriptional MerR regulator